MGFVRYQTYLFGEIPSISSPSKENLPGRITVSARLVKISHSEVFCYSLPYPSRQTLVTPCLHYCGVACRIGNQSQGTLIQSTKKVRLRHAPVIWIETQRSPPVSHSRWTNEKGRWYRRSRTLIRDGRAIRCMMRRYVCFDHLCCERGALRAWDPGAKKGGAKTILPSFVAYTRILVRVLRHEATRLREGPRTSMILESVCNSVFQRLHHQRACK